MLLIAESHDGPVLPIWMPFLPQFLQLSKPPSLPPIFEMARPELKLAGMRIEPDLFSGSKMGYSIDMAIVESDQVLLSINDYRLY